MTFQDRIMNDKSIYDLLRDEKYFIEQYQRIESFLLTIREEKIWKNSKFNDAIFTYEQLKETTSCLFQPLINIYDIEAKFLQYLLCPIESLFIEVENRCDTALEEITILKSILPNHRNHNNQKILDTINIEYILMESEIILLQAVIDLKRSNVTASAHKFLKSYQRMIEIKKTLNDYYEYNDKKTKYETAYFLQMVENRPLICDQKLLQALNHLIQEKIQELRIEYSIMSSNGGNNGDIVINDDTLQSTRDLLHLKQLYQQLSCEYQKYEEERQLLQKELNKGSRKRKSVKSLGDPNKKDDSHSSTLVDENNHPNTNIPVRGRSASTTVVSSKVPLGNSNQPKKSIFDGRNIAASFNLSSVSETCGNIISNAVDKISTSINSSHQTTAANAPNTTSEKKIITKHNNENEELVNSIMSPKKVEMPVVSVLLPRMSDVAKMFDFENTIDIKRRKSQHTTNETTTGGQKGVKSNSLAHLDLAQVKSQNSPSSKLLKQIVNPDDLDFHRLHSVFDNDFYELFFIQSKSRISFIESIFTIGLALLPKNSQWVLEIVNVSSNIMHITKAISLLYKLHHYDNHRWNKLVTLVLINIPHHLYEQVWTDNHHTFPFLVNDFNNVNHIEQIYQIIEAQSIIKPWTGRNPLWLASLARQSSVMTRVHENAITTNIHKRIDYYRRIITLEKDTLPIDHTLGFYEYRNLLARDLLRTGNWILALQQSRELLERLKNSIPSLYNYALIQSSTAALILTEFFNCQKVFLPLKFANNKFIHNENLVAAAAPSTLPAGMISIDHSSYQYDEISDIIAAFNFQQYLGSMRQYMNVMMIPFEYQTLFHRISEYEDYYGMLVLEEKKRQQEKEAEEEETPTTVDTEEQPIESPTETQEIEEIDVIEEIKQGPVIEISNSHEANELMQKRKEENLKVDYYCFWSWLMPLETIYLLLRPFGFLHEAAHSSLLSICDKGGLLFADKYLIKSWELAQQLAAQQAAASTTINSADMMILDYPVLSSETTISEQPKIVINRADEPYQQMGYFIKSIIIDEIVAKDPSVVRKAIYPTNKLKLYFEEIIMTGDKQLRIDCEENYSTLFSVSGKPSGNGSAGSGSSFNPFSTSSAASTNSSTTGGGFFQMLQTPLLSENSLLSGLASRMNIGGGPDRYALDMKAVKVLQKIKERHEHYNIELKPFYQQAQHLVDRESLKVKKSDEEDSDDKESEEDDMYRWIRLEAPKKPQKVYGDQLLTWLLLRGLILLELNRIGEAIMMFKLMECYKETAPRTKFAMFVGYYHLAEIVLQYDVCDFPILVAAEYLKRASVYLQRAYESKCYHYIHEYHPKILTLTQKLLTSTTSNA